MNQKDGTAEFADIALKIPAPPSRIKLRNVVTCAKLNMRRCSHLLNKSVVPLGDQQDVQRGNHRVFSPVQAFNLVLAFRLSELRVPVGSIKKLMHAFSRHYKRFKLGAEDEFVPPQGKFLRRFDWQLIVSRGNWMVVVPREHVPVWLLGGGVQWYSLGRSRLERPAGDALQLCWLQVPLAPIAKCVAPILVDLDLGLDNS